MAHPQIVEMENEEEEEEAAAGAALNLKRGLS
jgi:hypothetical protein